MDGAKIASHTDPASPYTVPFISRIQKITLYESSEVYYVLGSDEAETKFRILEISRCEPKELSIYDDKILYTLEGIRNRINHLKGRDKGRLRLPFSRTALTKVTSGFGIVGFVRFLEGYYMVIVTARKKVAIFGGHTVFKIEETKTVYIPNDVTRSPHPDEQRYLKLFQNVDLSSNFYFSYSYDLTHTLQYNCAGMKVEDEPNGDVFYPTAHCFTRTLSTKLAIVRGEPQLKFAWNAYLLKDVQEWLHSDWLLYVIHGFVGQSNLSIFGRPVYLTLIARRSNRYAGTRFFKRGINSQGDVANDVETEQIVFDASTTQFKDGCYTSFTQHRGSIPVMWSQDPTKLMPKPPISLDQNDAFGAVGGLHFRDMFKRYGSPVIALNLVKRTERRRHEGVLSKDYTDLLEYLNQFLTKEHMIRYIAFDMSRASKKKGSDVLLLLEEISERCLKKTNFYASNCPGLAGDQKQTGTVRTNCVDCLDRTNTAQFALGKCALGRQLCALGVLSDPKLLFDTDCVRMLEELYEDLGDTIALQYGGSNLVHRIQTYRKTAPLTSHSNDILQTLSRYYSNAFSDAEKQMSLNVFLGIYVPSANAMSLWDLPTDVYLHNAPPKDESSLPRDACNYYRSPLMCRGYCDWLGEGIREALPLPYDEATKKGSIVDICSADDYPDILTEYYKTKEMTGFQELLSFYMPNSIRDFMPKGVPLAQSSPFCVRKMPEWKHLFQTPSVGLAKTGDFEVSAAFNAPTGFTVVAWPPVERNLDKTFEGDSSLLNMSQSTSDGESLFDDDADIEYTFSDNEAATPVKSTFGDTSFADDANAKKGRNAEASITFKDVFESPATMYGVDPEGCLNSSQLKVYRHYVKVGADDGAVLMSKSFYPFGSEQAVEPPTVKKEAKHVYKLSVEVACAGPKPVSDRNKRLYESYVAQLYQ